MTKATYQELFEEVKNLRLRQVCQDGTLADQELYRDVGENALLALLTLADNIEPQTALEATLKHNAFVYVAEVLGHEAIRP